VELGCRTCIGSIPVIKSLAVLSIAAHGMSLSELNKLTRSFESSPLMPLLFVGHGSPMNAIEENVFVKGWRKMGESIPSPTAVLCISAHWETQGTFVTAMEKPATIHDFGGFPPALYEVQYPAPGNPGMANETKETVHSATVELDQKWGLDHGCWSVVRHLYPKADIPVLQLSLDYSKPSQYHFDLGRELNALRRKGVLIVGSGNIVHNLSIIDWKNPDSGFEWAEIANSKIKKLVMEGDFNSLIYYQKLGKELELSVPSPEHYLPLLYILALKQEKENIAIYNNKTVMGSISMCSFKIE
jgi:4,5-DOPA dioxygenase extradiol